MLAMKIAVTALLVLLVAGAISSDMDKDGKPFLVMGMIGAACCVIFLGCVLYAVWAL